MDVVQRFAIPAQRDTELGKRLDLRGQKECPVVDGVVERLDAEAVARGEELAVARVPDRQRELAAQRMKRACPSFFKEVKRNLAVRSRAKDMTVALERLANPLEVVELTVGDDAQPFVLVGDRLIAGFEIDDAQARVAEPGAAVRRRPDVLRVRPAMAQPSSRQGERLARRCHRV